MAQASQAFDLKTLQPKDLLGIVEFSGLPNFKGSSVANMLNSQGYQAVPIVVDLKPLDAPLWETFSRFAEDFEDAKLRKRCLKAIEASVRQQGLAFKHLYFPAIFGLSNPEDFLKSVQLKTQVSASELLGLAHSIPGLRLASILEKGSHRDMVTAFKFQDQKIVELTLGTGEIIHPKAVVLATGRFLSGGFLSSPNFQETVFGLPLARVERSQAKLAVDAEQRPLNASGKLFATNLFAAGANLSGYVPTDEDGMGRAIMTGYRAAEIIINKYI
jgi:anaerobic glycerol-3-phosphate dehydrogenase